jgi:flagellar biosynthesis anti-sigma factor FlgM
MKIGLNTNKVINTYNQGSKVTQLNANKHVQGDKIDISKEGREIQKYIEGADNTELKNSRVEEIKALINQNKYKVDSEKLAQSILNHIKESDK